MSFKVYSSVGLIFFILFILIFGIGLSLFFAFKSTNPVAFTNYLIFVGMGTLTIGIILGAISSMVNKSIVLAGLFILFYFVGIVAFFFALNGTSPEMIKIATITGWSTLCLILITLIGGHYLT